MDKIATQKFVLVGKKEIAETKDYIEINALDNTLIKILAVGICGSDLHYFNFRKDERKLEQIKKKHLVLGHEAAGRIISALPEAAYPDGTKVLVGDLVAIDPLSSCYDLGIPPCLACQNPALGESYCFNSAFLGSTRDGALHTYFSYSSKKLIKLAEDISPLEGALLEPLAIAAKIAKKEANSNKKVVIIGDGSLGLLIGKMLSYYGSKDITIFGINDAKLSFARTFARTINLSETRGDWSGLGSLVIECVGGEHYPITIPLAIGSCIAGGKILLVGLSHLKPQIDLQEIIKKGIFIEGAFRCSYQDMISAYRLFSDRKLREEIRKIVDPEIYPLTLRGVQEAFTSANNYSLLHGSKVVMMDPQLLPLG